MFFCFVISIGIVNNGFFNVFFHGRPPLENFKMIGLYHVLVELYKNNVRVGGKNTMVELMFIVTWNFKLT